MPLCEKYSHTKARFFVADFKVLIRVFGFAEKAILHGSKYDFMHENELAKIVVSAAYNIHSNLGPGLFESVYETIMEHELVTKHHLYVVRQFPLPVTWEGAKMELGFRADLLIENKLIVELKSIESLAPVHYKQMLTYLKLSGIKLGLLINFNEELLKTGIKRIINGSL